MTNPEVHARHTEFSDPGPHRERLAALPDEVDAINAAARNIIGHYRAELKDLPEERWSEVDSRWLATILDVDARRHDLPLDEPRPFDDRVAGCCREHSLFDRRDDWSFDPLVLPSGAGAPFETAVEAWLRHVAGETDLAPVRRLPGLGVLRPGLRPRLRAAR